MAPIMLHWHKPGQNVTARDYGKLQAVFTDAVRTDYYGQNMGDLNKDLVPSHPCDKVQSGCSSLL